MKTPERSWIGYFAWVDPDTPYLRLFRSIVQVAYVALGGDVVDQCLAAARQMDADYQRDQAQPPRQDDPLEKQRRPVGHREGAGARRDCWKYEAGGRKRYEEACEVVRKLFRSVLGYDAILPHEPEETPEHKPEDPEMVRKIEQRAENLRNLRPPAPPRERKREAPLDEDLMRENVMLRQHLRQADMQIHQMKRTVMAMQRMVATGGAPEDKPAETPTQTTGALREEGPYTKLVLSPTEPTAETLAPFPAEDHAMIRGMWQQMQLVEKLGVPKEVIQKALLGDPQAQQQLDEMVRQAEAAGV